MTLSGSFDWASWRAISVKCWVGWWNRTCTLSLSLFLWPCLRLCLSHASDYRLIKWRCGIIALYKRSGERERESTVIETVVCDSESCSEESNYSGAHFPYSSELTIRFDQRETTKANDWLNNKESLINGFIYKEWLSENPFDDLYAHYRSHTDIILPIFNIKKKKKTMKQNQSFIRRFYKPSVIEFDGWKSMSNV